MGQISSTQNNIKNGDVNNSQSVLYREKRNATLPGKNTNTSTGSGGNATRKGSDLQVGDRIRPVTMAATTLNFSDEDDLKKLEIVSRQTEQISSAIENGYHKTDYCYYRTPQGNFHKLPSDSYHKMSEGCYVRLADGNYRRLHVLDNTDINKKLLDTNFNRNSLTLSSSNNGGNTTNNNIRNIVAIGDKMQVPGSSKVKNHMMKFLKRSKSHTPATIKQLQSYNKDFSYIDRKLNAKIMPLESGITTLPPLKEVVNNPCSNNKVVVTMMENGGLPIVATSKAEKFKKQELENSSKSKAKKVIYTLNTVYVRVFMLYFVMYVSMYMLNNIVLSLIVSEVHFFFIIISICFILFY